MKTYSKLNKHNKKQNKKQQQYTHKLLQSVVC